MAEHEPTLFADHRNLVSRRLGALWCRRFRRARALPAGAAVAASGSPFDTQTTGAPTRSLIALWRDRQAPKAAADAGEYGPHEDELVDRLVDIENAVLSTVPVSPEGAAIVATVLLESQDEQDALAQRSYGRPALRDPDRDGGVSLARHILAQTPADVLRRAGLEARS